MQFFSEFPFSPVVQENLKKHGFEQPTPVQTDSIPPALEGRDVLATAQTGTGKTLAFLLPILERLGPVKSKGIQAVVLVPTRELAMQVMETLQKLTPKTGVSGALVVGGLGEGPQLQAIARGAQIVVATPGRLEDFLRRNLVKLNTVHMLVLDEADRMLDMGFQPSIRYIADALPEQRQTLFFSATMDPEVSHLVRRYLKNPARVEIGSTRKPAEGVKLQVFEVQQDQKLGLLHQLIEREPGSFLVFTRTKHSTERLAKKLARAGVSATRIHGDRTQGQRTAALQGFQRGHYRVLVATDIAARGIHVDEIAHVVNFDLPQQPEDFIHRVGRTGRASSTGKASTIVTRSESGDVRRLEKLLQLKLERVQWTEEIPLELPVVHVLPPSSTAKSAGPRPRTGPNASNGRPRRFTPRSR